MKKVVLVLLGFLCLLLVGEVQADCTGTIFSDVNEASVGYQFCDYIERFSVLGITTGYPDGTFRPANYPTRGQMAAFFMRAIDKVVQPQIKVYDANDQYLGNFISLNNLDSIAIFIPSLMKHTSISTSDGLLLTTYHLFETGDCTGQAYSTSSSMFNIWQKSGKYYTGVATIPTPITANSHKYGETCESYGWTFNMVPVNEITLPFTLPVALPMRLE